MKRTLPLFAFLFLGAFALGSSISCDSVDEAFDCSQVCGRYHDCYDSSYDVGECETRCRANAASDPNVKAAADACESCIGDMSCPSATFNCGGSCGAIVP
ncbi:MAG TPA: hypothetical protein VLT58_15820 [Polyangia bacterium]|nr:hypothetical protein [Polyangia bacterium]